MDLRFAFTSPLHNGVVLFVLGHQDDPPDRLEASTLSSLNGLSQLYFSYFIFRICFVLCISVCSTDEKDKY